MGSLVVRNRPNGFFGLYPPHSSDQRLVASDDAQPLSLLLPDPLQPRNHADNLPHPPRPQSLLLPTTIDTYFFNFLAKISFCAYLIHYVVLSQIIGVESVGTYYYVPERFIYL